MSRRAREIAIMDDLLTIKPSPKWMAHWDQPSTVCLATVNNGLYGHLEAQLLPILRTQVYVVTKPDFRREDLPSLVMIADVMKVIGVGVEPGSLLIWTRLYLETATEPRHK
ncbi:hypothetical protein TWF481_006218 [Arthrobotrys musiformis]|uniref:Uncharacterized protein n=1 Tax=Arthrobotrys musiformis TaxID=47236 RepID=A0AAV9WH15_9PEZI